jgi:hypothetical protein
MAEEFYHIIAQDIILKIIRDVFVSTFSKIEVDFYREMKKVNIQKHPDPKTDQGTYELQRIIKGKF